MEKLKKYGNSIWRVPLIAVIAGFLYAPIYTRIVLGFGIIQPGVIDKRVSLFAGAGITMAVLILGGMLLLRGLSKKERFISAFVLSAYGILLLLVQSLLGAVTGPGAIVFMYLWKPLEWTGFFVDFSFYLRERFGFSLPLIGWLRCLVPFLFVLFGHKTHKSEKYETLAEGSVFMDHTVQDARQFFDSCPDTYPLYECFVQMLVSRFPETRIKVQKSQISFYNRHLYACVSFLRVKKKAELPESYFVLTLGLAEPLNSDRVAVKTEPYPGRWTTHFVISKPSDLDEELFGWITQAYDFAQLK